MWFSRIICSALHVNSKSFGSRGEARTAEFVVCASRTEWLWIWKPHACARQDSSKLGNYSSSAFAGSLPPLPAGTWEIITSRVGYVFVRLMRADTNCATNWPIRLPECWWCYYLNLHAVFFGCISGKWPFKLLNARVCLRIFIYTGT